MLRARQLILLGAGAACLGAALFVGAVRSAHSSVGMPPIVARPAALALQAPANSWLNALAPALAMAKARDQDVLLEFSAPEVSPECASIDADVFNNPKFTSACRGDLVLLRLVSQGPTGPQAQVTMLAQELGVERFPTLVLIDSIGRPYARTDLRAWDVARYLNEISRLHAIRARRDAAMARAEVAIGVARARELDAALKCVGPLASCKAYAPIVREIVDLDPGNEAGLKAQYAQPLLVRNTDAAIQEDVYPLIDRGAYPAALARIDRIIVELKPEAPQMQLLLAFKGQLCFTMGDRASAARWFDDAIRLDPGSESAQRVRAARAQLGGPS